MDEWMDKTDIYIATWMVVPMKGRMKSVCMGVSSIDG
jgi:hypothetical protein